MMNVTSPDNQDSNSDCMGLVPPYELSWMTPMLLLQHALMTIPLTIVLTKMAYDKTDLEHPVFAIVIQELFVLTVCELMSLGSLILSIFIRSESVARAYFLGMRLASLFHPSTWLVISYLRYHLLIAEDDAIDMTSMKKKSLKAVWGLFFISLLSQVAVQAYLIMRGWPEVSMSKIGADTSILMFTLAASASNIPDIFSIVIYIKMWRYFRSKVEPEISVSSPEIPMDDVNYGGIWVGGVGDVISTHSSSPQEDLPPNIDTDQFSSEKNEHRTRSVLKTLHWHVGFSLVDMFLPVMSILSCSGLILRFMYLIQVVFYFLVPLLVIKVSFEQLSNTKEYILQIMHIM